MFFHYITTLHVVTKLVLTFSILTIVAVVTTPADQITANTILASTAVALSVFSVIWKGGRIDQKLNDLAERVTRIQNDQRDHDKWHMNRLRRGLDERDY